jgi:glycosyltransferase involved in cell wall biosynthesis
VATVAFDIRANHDTGVARYGWSLLRAVAPLAAEARWNLLALVRPHDEARAWATLGDTPGVRVFASSDEGFVRRCSWIREFLISHKVDLYFTSHYILDRLCPVPFVFTIHDLTRLRFPHLSYTDEAFVRRFGDIELDHAREDLAALDAWAITPGHGDAFPRYFHAINRYLVHRAERIITVSHSTAHDIETLLDVDRTKLDLVPCGVDMDTFHRQTTSSARTVRRLYGLAGPYLIFVGLTHPNKRFAWLLEQLICERWRFPSGSQLVAVGGHAEQLPDIRSLLADRNADDFLVLTGRVPDAHLAALYSEASALVTASVNEGNNLPPLEAMACGTQVVATDIPPLRETLGLAASFYDPNSGEGLARLAAAALTGTLANRTRLFRPPAWPTSGRQLVDALSRALEGLHTSTRKRVV